MSRPIYRFACRFHPSVPPMNGRDRERGRKGENERERKGERKREKERARE